jgi:transposase
LFRFLHYVGIAPGQPPVRDHDFTLGAALAAEILFLRKQLAYYQDHQIRPRRLRDASRLCLLFWSRLFDWQAALVVVKMSTFIRWHRKGFKLYWRWKSRGGRPPLPKEIRQLIARMVRENVTWGEERIADELSLKLGIHVSPRTIRKILAAATGDFAADAGEARLNIGRPLSAIMLRASWPAIF